MAPQNLFADARRALAWSAIAKWLDVGGSAAIFLAMVTLLGPDIFGLYGMALVATALPEAIAGGALSESIVQRRDLRPGHLNATFWMELGLALVLFVVLLFLTPHLAKVFGQQQLLQLIPVMAGTLFLLALGAAAAGKLQRELRFKAIAAVDAIGSICAAVVGLVLALMHFGVWSLIWMEVSRRGVRSIAFAACAGWRPSFSFNMQDVRDLARFNIMTLATRVANEADNAVPRFFIGATLGPHALGYFNFAWRIYQQAAAIIIAPFWAVAMPVASNAQHDHALLRSALNGAAKLTSLIAYPIFLGAAAIAPLAIPTLLGKEWAPAVVVVQIILLNGIRAGASPLTTGVLRGVGAAGWSLAIVAAEAVMGLLLTPLAAPFGLAAVAWVTLGRSYWAWLAGAALLKRAIGYPIWPQFFIGWRSLASAAVMAAVVWTLQRFALPAGSGLLGVAGLVAVGMVVYVATLFVLSPQLAQRLVNIALAVLRRDRETLSALLRPAA